MTAAPENSQNPNPTPSSQRRRSALKKMLVGTGVAVAAALPSRWTKPVVDCFLLPAHAATSPTPPPGTTVTTTTTTTTTQPPDYTIECDSHEATCEWDDGLGKFKIEVDVRGTVTATGEASVSGLGVEVLFQVGCVNEAYAPLKRYHVYTDSTGGFSVTDVLISFDDFGCRISVDAQMGLIPTENIYPASCWSYIVCRR